MLVANDVNVKRGKAHILHDVSLRASPGELIGILGPSGCGKSTLLYALSGFRPATQGSVRLGQARIPEDFESVKHTIGFVPQDDVVPASLRVRRVLEYSADLRLVDHDAAYRTQSVNAVLRVLGLKEHDNTRVSKLSGGQRKRVSVGVELLSKPEVLFADEPTSGLDPALERSLMETFRDLASQDKGRIIIITTHIMSSLELFDKVCVMVKGRIAYFGEVDRLKSFFGVDDYTKIYEALEKKSPEQWALQHKSP